jgi:hypothetical protein
MADGFDSFGGSGMGGMGGMGGTGGMMNPLSMDPAYQTALRQQMYGQSLMALGSETTPIRSGYQAAARALQGVLGGYFMHSGQQQALDYAQQSREAQAQQYANYPLLGLPPAGGNLPQGPPPQAPAGGYARPSAQGNVPPGGTAPASMYSAIQGTEGSGPNATSYAGARGSFQVTAPFFNTYAQKGESFDNETDRVAVAKRGIDALWQQNNGDPARVATAYFSGQGNVAPPGSQNPWINAGGDRYSTVPSYVNNVVNRFTAAGGAGGGDPNAPSTGGPGGGPLVIGDSLASSGGLGGSGTVGAQPSAIRAQIAQQGDLGGRDVVLSSGASNAPGDMANVEGQLQALKAGKAGNVTLMGVGPGIEARSPGTNAALQKLAEQYGAKFQALPADQMAPDGVHPTGAGYTALRNSMGLGAPYQVADASGRTPPPSAPPATTPGGYTPTGNPQNDAANWGMNLAGQYRDMAAAAARSPYAAVRAMSQNYMQDALRAMQYGRYQVTGYLPSGQPAMVDRATGKLEPVGAEPHLTETPQGWINPLGQVVAPSDDTILSTLSPKMQSGTASPQEQSVYNGAYGRRFAPKWEQDQTQGGAWKLLPAPNAPTNLYTPPGFGGATPPNQPPGAAGTGAGPALQPYGGGQGATMPQPQKVLAQANGVPTAPGDPYSSMTPAKANEAFQSDRTEATKAAAATDSEANESRVQLAQLERMRTLIGKGVPVGSDISDLTSRAIAMHWSNNADLQEFNQLSQSLVPSMRIGSGISRVTNKDMEIFQNMVPNSGESAQANINIINAAERKAQMALEHNQYLHDYASANGRMDGAETGWQRYLDANPIFAPGSSATRPTLTPPGQNRRAWFQQNTDPNSGALYPQVTTQSGMPNAGQYRGQAIRDDQGQTYVSNGQTWVKR